MSSGATRSFFTQSNALLGIVEAVDHAKCEFALRCRSGDVFLVNTGGNSTTSFGVVRNVDGLDRDRIPTPSGFGGKPSDFVFKYVRIGALLSVRGVEIEHNGVRRFQASIVTSFEGDQGQFVFEDTHWWLTQIARFADKWLDDLFQDRRSLEWDDFVSSYRTNLDIVGRPTDDNIQECATLSRLIYGLSSSYLITGSERYRLAAAAGVRFQRETFRSLSHDARYCFWAFGIRKNKNGFKLIMGSENGDDLGTIPLYEQIYALAGLTQYFRISQDLSVLEDISRTIRMFNDFYRDAEGFGYGGTGGYFSHIDTVTLRPDVDALGQNKLRKNWNSIGDHIPAYLVNLIIALDPLPLEAPDHKGNENLLNVCREMLAECSELIVKHFPDPASDFVNERFFDDWAVDHEWGWQQNRAIVGHNFKIGWNLTRVAHYYESRAAVLHKSEPAAAEALRTSAHVFRNVAVDITNKMSMAGIDQVRGGCFDAVERIPLTGMPVEFAWSNTKDFWQQEQAILCYLIVHGFTGNALHLALAREMMAFWNLFFLDRDRHSVFFRTTDDGLPVIEASYSQKAGHAIAGYHSFELNYLAHVYIRTYVRPEGLVRSPEGKAVWPVVDQNFCLFFRPDDDCPNRSLNVLPDFAPPGSLEIASIRVGSVPRGNFNPQIFQIELNEDDLGKQIVVEFRPLGGPNPVANTQLIALQ